MRISIIIPVYNIVSYLEKCIDSCFFQDCTALEVIAVDDGSCDGSEILLDAYAQKEPRLKVVHQPNSGVVAARMKGVEMATGEWIMFLDGDDFLAADCLKHLEEAVMMYPSAMLISGNICYYDPVRGTTRNHKDCLASNVEKKEIITALLQGKVLPSLCGRLIHSVLLTNHTPREIKIGEDFVEFIQIVEKSLQSVFIAPVVYYYVQRSNSVTKRPSNEAVLSMLSFIRWVEQHCKDWHYTDYPDTVVALDIFILNQYFTYLCLGGQPLPRTEMISGIFGRALRNPAATAAVPCWRVGLIWLCVRNRILGSMAIKSFVGLKKRYKRILK